MNNIPRKSNREVEKCNRLFVYGTLQSGQSRNHILKELTFKKATLSGFRKVSPSELGFPFIIVDKKSHVEGEVYFGLRSTHWDKIDAIEGEGTLYHRILVKIKLENERKISSFVYYPSKKLIESFLNDNQF